MKFRSIAVDGPIGVGKTSFVELLARRFDAYKVLEELDNPFLDGYVLSTRERGGQEIIFKKGALREMLRVVKKQNNLAVISDQNAGRHGIFVSFFGRPASATPAPAITGTSGTLILGTVDPSLPAGSLVQIFTDAADEGQALREWVGAEAKRWGKGFSRQADALLIEWVGESLGALSSEIEKLGLVVVVVDRLEGVAQHGSHVSEDAIPLAAVATPTR